VKHFSNGFQMKEKSSRIRAKVARRRSGAAGGFEESPRMVATSGISLWWQRPDFLGCNEFVTAPALNLV